MENNDPTPYSLAAARADIAKLNEERIAQLNRILATEAMMKTLIAELPLDVLQEIEERYDLRVLNGMQHLSPHLQRPALWEPYLDKIREVIALRKRTQGD